VANINLFSVGSGKRVFWQFDAAGSNRNFDNRNFGNHFPRSAAQAHHPRRRTTAKLQPTSELARARINSGGAANGR